MTCCFQLLKAVCVWIYLNPVIYLNIFRRKWRLERGGDGGGVGGGGRGVYGMWESRWVVGIQPKYQH